VKLGNRHADGGYVMVDDFEGVDAALSLGIGDDLTWDLEMASKGIHIYQFDHTIDPPAAAADQPHLHFYRTGIAGEDDSVRNLKTIGSVLADEMRMHRGDLILKIDIDGYEWDVFAGMPAAVLARFRQICIEIHNPLARPSQRARRARNLAVLRKLHAFFAPVHIHANNAGPVRRFFRLEVPKLLEITYVRRGAHAFVDSTESFPGALDVPNVASKPEIPIGRILRG